MTTTPPVRLTQCDLTALHATIATSDTLQRERRALYQLAAELLDRDIPAVLDPDVLDSPLARNHIGTALAGRVQLSRCKLVGLSALAERASSSDPIRVVSRPEANTLFAEALDTVRLELDRQQAASTLPELLTEDNPERFASALAILRAGVAFARSTSPELLEDLIAHVAVVGILDPQRTGRLVSASSRTFPGLVLLEASSSIDVAEAIVHEGAHQKLFDLAITHDLLSADSDRCPPFHPPWAPEDRQWPIEQTLAACHAYACLARFWQDAEAMEKAVPVGVDSLLPVARERSELIGQWLWDRGNYLGTDAQKLVAGMLGRWPRTSTGPAESCSGAAATDYVVDPTLALRRCGSDRVLVGRPLRPPQLYWISDDAAKLLELSKLKSIGELSEMFAQRWHIAPSDARNRLTALLSELSATGLITPRNTKD